MPLSLRSIRKSFVIPGLAAAPERAGAVHDDRNTPRRGRSVQRQDEPVRCRSLRHSCHPESIQPSVIASPALKQDHCSGSTDIRLWPFVPHGYWTWHTPDWRCLIREKMAEMGDQTGILSCHRCCHHQSGSLHLQTGRPWPAANPETFSYGPDNCMWPRQTRWSKEVHTSAGTMGWMNVLYPRARDPSSRATSSRSF